MTAHSEALQYREATADNIRTWCQENGIPDPYKVLTELQYIADPYNVLNPLEKEKKLYQLSQDIDAHIKIAKP